jgi:hypothetical protein
MTIRLLVFLSALLFMLLGMPGALQAQQQETGPAGRRVIIFVWDGLRADELTRTLRRTTSRWPGRASSLQTTMPSIPPSR